MTVGTREALWTWLLKQLVRDGCLRREPDASRRWAASGEGDEGLTGEDNYVSGH